MSAQADAFMGIFGMKRVKQKKCKHCKALFTPSKPIQTACSIACAVAMARKKRENVEKAADRQKREALKSRSQWLKEAQTVFNKYIRTRDRNKSCICCGKPLNAEQIGGGFDAGHYRSIGSAPHLRFDERNCHGQTKQCNRYGAGRAVDYRIGLIGRIGILAVEALEADQSPKNYTIEELKAIKATYVAKLKEMKNAMQD